MKVFALDLWHDLREKRLWPVALVLLAGLVAVPVLLAKPAEDPGPPPEVSATPAVDDKEASGQLAQVKLEGDQAASGSTLGVFDPSNPFKPPKKVIEASRNESGSNSQAGPADQSASDKAGTGSSAGSDSGGGTTPPSSGGGTTPPSSGGGTTPPSSGGEPTTTVYEYVVDVTFTANGRTRRIKGMEKLDMLPSQAAPLLIAMGVTADGGNAVFMVDSTLKGAGEGRCKPSGRDCAFAYIGPGSEHVFTDEDGDTYTVRIDEIRKVEVKRDRATAGKAEGARATASIGSPRRFVPPLIADVVEVASDTLEDSNSDSDRR